MGWGFSQDLFKNISIYKNRTKRKLPRQLFFNSYI